MLAVCSLFRREAPYLREWIEFHLMMGVEHFYLYDDASEDHWWPVLRPYDAMGLTTIIDFPLRGRTQVDAYQHCINRLTGKDILLAVIDIDEFLWSPKFDTLTEAIASVPLPEQWSALTAQWMCFGSGGQQDYENRPVIERFTWRPREENFYNQWQKCILNLSADPAIQVQSGDPHIFNTSYGMFDENGQPTYCPKENHSSEILRINHYFTKSRQEWETRHPVDEPILGGLYPRDESRWSGVQAMEVDDREIQRFLPELNRRLGR